MVAQQLALVVVLGLAAYRAARLVTRDSLTDTARAAVSRWAFDEDRDHWRSRPRWYVHELVTCPFCVGVWAALGAYAWWDHLPGQRWAVVVAAAAGVQAIAASRPGA